MMISTIDSHYNYYTQPGEHNMTRVGAVHGALGPGGGGLRGGGGRGDDGAQAHRQALLHLQVGARIELQTKVHTKVRNQGEGPCRVESAY